MADVVWMCLDVKNNVESNMVVHSLGVRGLCAGVAICEGSGIHGGDINRGLCAAQLVGRRWDVGHQP